MDSLAHRGRDRHRHRVPTAQNLREVRARRERRRFTPIEAKQIAGIVKPKKDRTGDKTNDREEQNQDDQREEEEHQEEGQEERDEQEEDERGRSEGSRSRSGGGSGSSGSSNKTEDDGEEERIAGEIRDLAHVIDLLADHVERVRPRRADARLVRRSISNLNRILGAIDGDPREEAA